MLQQYNNKSTQFLIKISYHGEGICYTVYMITLVLVIHLLFAAVYSLLILTMTIVAAMHKKVQYVAMYALGSFGATIVSGVGLVLLSPKSMAQFCTSTVIASVFGIVAWRLYSRRVLAFQPTDSTVY